MSIPPVLQNSFGVWTGLNRLWLSPDESPRASNTTVTVSRVAMDKFVTVAYTWAYEGEAQAGLLLLGCEPAQKTVSAVWVDSWHMGDAMMTCQGVIDSNDHIKLEGTYAFAGGPAWGWRIVIRLEENDALKLLMYNISPEGQEDLAVEADCVREADASPI